VGFVAVGPSQSFWLQNQRGLIRSRPHDVAVDRLKKDSTNPGSRVSPPANSSEVSSQSTRPSLSSNEAVEARRHVNRYARIQCCAIHIALYPSVVARNDRLALPLA